MAEVQSYQQAPDRPVLRGKGGRQELLDLLLLEPGELRELVAGERVDIRGILHPSHLDQLDPSLVAEAVDVHRPARSEREEPLDVLRRAPGLVGTEPVRAFADERGAARRTFLR